MDGGPGEREETAPFAHASIDAASPRPSVSLSQLPSLAALLVVGGLGERPNLLIRVFHLNRLASGPAELALLRIFKCIYIYQSKFIIKIFLKYATGRYERAYVSLMMT